MERWGLLWGSDVTHSLDFRAALGGLRTEKPLLCSWFLSQFTPSFTSLPLSRCCTRRSLGEFRVPWMGTHLASVLRAGICPVTQTAPGQPGNTLLGHHLPGGQRAEQCFASSRALEGTAGAGGSLGPSLGCPALLALHCLHLQPLQLHQALDVFLQRSRGLGAEIRFPFHMDKDSQLLQVPGVERRREEVRVVIF